jgi:protein-S-isoprenylcysteine O-methyltransferase Ste14
MKPAAAAKAGDALARCGLALWFFFVAVVLVPQLRAAFAAAASLAGLLALFAKVALFGFCLTVVALALTRLRPLAKSAGLRPRLEAALGAFLVYALPFLPPARRGPALEAASGALVACGTALALVSMLALGRSFSVMAEARALVTSGPFRLIRHPLYLAEGLAALGAAIQFVWPASLALVAAQLAFQIRRIFNEETLLRRIFPEYAAYAARTARLVPGLW